MPALLIVAAVLLLLAAPAQAAPGELDPSFSGDGRQVTDFGGHDRAFDVAVQPDGRIVVAGSTDGDFALARFSPDGSLDVGFATDGRQNTDFGTTASATAVAVQPDGKIVVVGGAGQDFALARYTPDGTLDASFSGDGLQTTDFDGAIDEAADVVLQSDGKIVAAGYALSGTYDFALARYNPDGSLDASFANDGTRTVDLGADDVASAIALQADGKLIAAGRTGSDFWGGYDFALARFDIDASLDPTFSDDGLQMTDLGGDDLAYDVALQPDGKVVAVGYGGPAGYDFALARYRGDGSLDPGFAGDGTTLTDFHAYDGASGVAIQADGRIVVAGVAGRGPAPSDFAIARYEPDGSLDATFAGDGRQTTDFGYDDAANRIALQPDGRIVAAGLTGPINGGGDFALARYQGGSQPGTAPASASPPTISGVATEGQTLTAIPGSWTGTSPVSLAHQWRRCDSAGAACIDITSGSGMTYSLVAADVGRTVRVRETVANPFGTATADSAATAPVKARAGAIAGTVRRAGTKQGIAGAAVGCGGSSTKTAGDGRYSIPSLAPGTYGCTASANGFAPSSHAVTVASGQTTIADFGLTRR